MLNQKAFLRLIFSLFLLILFAVVGCSSTGQVPADDTEFDDVADIDQLLGLADDKTDTQENIAEDDVLRLLGVSEASEVDVAQQEAEPPAGQTQMTMNDPVTSDQTSNAGQTQVAMQEPATQQTEPPPPPPRTQQDWGSGPFEERYQVALKTYRNRQYKSAIQKFEALLSESMTHSLSDNCQYWIGECYYGLGNYQQAIIAFEKVFTFAKSNKDDASQLKLGLCYMRLKNQQKAKEEFDKLIGNYPSSEYVTIAKRFIRKIEQ